MSAGGRAIFARLRTKPGVGRARQGVGGGSTHRPAHRPRQSWCRCPPAPGRCPSTFRTLPKGGGRTRSSSQRGAHAHTHRGSALLRRCAPGMSDCPRSAAPGRRGRSGADPTQRNGMAVVAVLCALAWPGRTPRRGERPSGTGLPRRALAVRVTRAEPRGALDVVAALATAASAAALPTVWCLVRQQAAHV